MEGNEVPFSPFMKAKEEELLLELRGAVTGSQDLYAGNKGLYCDILPPKPLAY